MSSPVYPRPFASYLLLERLGSGGMSEVDLARRAGDDATGRFVVIKRIRAGGGDERAVRMFLDEARINAQLSHENIAQVYASGRVDDEWYLEMEYVPGMDLRALQVALARAGRLIPPREALSILCKVLRALQYAHTRVDQLGRPMRIVHRDVNPRNVMVSTFGEVKLIDFGVARAAERLERTETNTVKGKFAYMAPEQIEGQAALDGRADLYAIGLMLHELLTGRSPFVGLSDVQILHRIMSGRIPSLPDDLDVASLPALRGVHARALAMRVEDRYADADAFREDLEAAAGPLGGLASPRAIATLLEEATGDRVREITERLRHWHDGELASFSGGGTMVPDRSGSQSRPSAVSAAGVPARGASAPERSDTMAWNGDTAGTGERFGTAVVATPVRTPPAPSPAPSDADVPTLLDGMPSVQELAAHAAHAAAPGPERTAAPRRADPAAPPRWPAAVLGLAAIAILGAGVAVVLHRAPEPAARNPRSTSASRSGAARAPGTPERGPTPEAPAAEVAPSAAPTVRPAAARMEPPSTGPRTPTAPTHASAPPTSPAVEASAPVPAAVESPTVPVVTPPAAAPPAAAAKAVERPDPGGNPGLLNVSVRGGPARVYLDGVLLGTAPRRGERVAPGRHVVRVENPDSGRASTREVVVEPGFNPPILFDAP